MWTERETKIAQSLQDKDTQALLKKIFVDLQTLNGEEIKKNVVALDDAEYGRMMKVVYLTRRECEAKLNLLNKVAKMKYNDAKPAPPIAPR